MGKEFSLDEEFKRRNKPVDKSGDNKQRPSGPIDVNTPAGILNLQRKAGNQAVLQLMAAQRRSAGGAGGFEVEEDVADRINSSRGEGQKLDDGIQTKMSESTGYDFSNVSVHTDGEANKLNESLGSLAFTTGQDMYFKAGAYNPHSSSGQELIAHEGTHVIQQGLGLVGGVNTKMTVTPSDDAFEKQADSVAHQVVYGGAQTAVGGSVQAKEEEDSVQLMPDEESLDEEDLPG